MPHGKREDTQVYNGIDYFDLDGEDSGLFTVSVKLSDDTEVEVLNHPEMVSGAFYEYGPGSVQLTPGTTVSELIVQWSEELVTISVPDTYDAMTTNLVAFSGAFGMMAALCDSQTAAVLSAGSTSAIGSRAPGDQKAYNQFCMANFDEAAGAHPEVAVEVHVTTAVTSGWASAGAENVNMGNYACLNWTASFGPVPEGASVTAVRVKVGTQPAFEVGIPETKLIDRLFAVKQNATHGIFALDSNCALIAGSYVTG